MSAADADAVGHGALKNVRLLIIWFHSNNFIFPTNVCLFVGWLVGVCVRAFRFYIDRLILTHVHSVFICYQFYFRSLQTTRIPLRQWQRQRWRRCTHIFNSFWIGYVNLMLKLRLLLLLFLDLGIHIFVIWVFVSTVSSFSLFFFSLRFSSPPIWSHLISINRCSIYLF